MGKTKARAKAKARRGVRKQRGAGKFDFQKWISKLGVEFHWPGYQYLGPGTKLTKRLKRGDPGINRLDKLARQHDIDCTKANNLAVKHVADRKMIASIRKFKGKKTIPERVVDKIMSFKLKAGI